MRSCQTSKLWRNRDVRPTECQILTPRLTEHLIPCLVLARLLTCATGECLHGEVKRATNSSNHRHVELDMLDQRNVRQAITFIIYGGLKHLHTSDSVYSADLQQSLTGDSTWLEILNGVGQSSVYAGNTSFKDSVSSVQSGGVGFSSLTSPGMFSRVTLPDLARFASKMMSGGFYRVDSSVGFHYAKAVSFFNSGRGPSVRVFGLSDHSTHPQLDCPILLLSNHSTDLLLSDVVYPVHIVPYCTTSSCQILQFTSPPKTLTSVPCLGLRGSHSSTTLFLFNTFYVK